MASRIRTASSVRLASPVSGSWWARSARRSSLRFCSVTSCMATTAPSFQPSSSTRAWPLTLTLRCSPASGLQDDLDVAQPLAGHGPEQRVLPRVHRRAVGVAEPRLVGMRPIGSTSSRQAVEAPGRRVEDGHPALGVAGHDALVEGVEQDLEELLLLAERGGRLRASVMSLNDATAPVTAPSALDDRPGR